MSLVLMNLALNEGGFMYQLTIEVGWLGFVWSCDWLCLLFSVPPPTCSNFCLQLSLKIFAIPTYGTHSWKKK